MNRQSQIGFALALLTLLAGAPTHAQSLFGTRGLGAPVDPIDPRARALGNVGLGLGGLNTSLVNPADLAGNLRRGVSATMQPFYGNEQLGDAEADVAGTRFPILHLIYPPRAQWVVGLGFGGFLDQSWATTIEGTEIIGTDTLSRNDLISARGALSQVRLSVAHQMTPSVDIGVAAGMYTGGVDRQLTRSFVNSTLAPFTFASGWDYSAPFAAIGVRGIVSPSVQASAAVTWSGQLDAEPREGENAGAPRSYDLPLRASFGASALVSRRLMATASAQWTGWSESEDYAAPGAALPERVAARPTIEVGGGVEWDQIRTQTRSFPLRVGYRYAQLPFHLEGDDPVTETALSFGLGLRLVADEFGPIAVGDLAFERGNRKGWGSGGGDQLSERFWRISASISLFGR